MKKIIMGATLLVTSGSAAFAAVPGGVGGLAAACCVALACCGIGLPCCG